MERETFLSGVRAAAAEQRLADPGRDAGIVPGTGTGDVVTRFRTNLEAVSGTVHEPASIEAAAATVIDLLHTTDAGEFLSWDESWMPVPGLLDALEVAGFRRSNDTVPTDAAARRDHQLGYLHHAVGLTGAEAGLAESGSIIVSSGPGRSRMASLIPDTHIALLRRDLLWPSLTHWIADHPDTLGTAANWTVITGPSLTADIEQVLTHGVHGPRAVHVVMV